ncbi:MAG: hypothetical protein ACO3PO_08290, partial [Limisphaerales bacterium]
MVFSIPVTAIASKIRCSIRLVNSFLPNKSTSLITLWVALVSTFLVACKSSYYKKKADKNTYGILEKIQNDLFGKKDPFTINTPYSDRSPDEISSQEILAERDLKEIMEIDVDRALEIAIASSREYQSQKESLYLSALSLSETEFVFSPQFLATAGADYTNPKGDGDPSMGISSQLSVSQLLRTGGRISANLTRDLTRFYVGNPRQGVSDA